MKAMVLAAGKGTRLFPLTGMIPKAMAPVVGKPIMEHIFELLAGSGVDEVYINVHHLADVILDPRYKAQTAEGKWEAETSQVWWPAKVGSGLAPIVT